MKKHFASLFAIVMLIVSCTETIDTSNRYTFTEETITSYLQKHEQFSEYVNLLETVKVSKYSESTVAQLLSARGNYTVFAPNNQAIQLYLDTLALKGIITEPSWDGFADQTTLDSIQHVIVFNSILDAGDDNDNTYQTSSFPEQNEEFLISNMNDRKLSVHYGTNPDSIFINGVYQLSQTNRDILAINGFIHEMQGVIAPSNQTLGDVISSMVAEGNGGFVVMAKLITACGLTDTLSRVKDERYEEMYMTGELNPELPYHDTEGSVGYLPEHRRYGFTLFAETDEFWSNTLGKSVADITVGDVREYIRDNNLCPGSVDDTNYKSVDNMLNQFVTYHLLPMRIPKNKLTIHYTEKGYNFSTSTTYTIPVWELYTTMGKRRIIKIYEAGPSGPEGFYLNRFPTLDNRRHGTYKETGCDPDKEGIHLDIPEDMGSLSFVNAIIYPINRALAYDNDTRDNFQKMRLRYDVAALFPEFMNNDIRIDRIGNTYTRHVGIPCTSDYNYLEDCEIADGSLFYYLSGYKCGWANYQGDELNVVGKYEMTFRLPPVPRKGTYEIRYLIGCGSSWRSMCQVYFGSDPNNLPAMGIPLDVRQGAHYRYLISGNVPSEFVGWQDDTDDDDFNAETDKKMRANGFMKGPEYYWPEISGSPTSTARKRDRILRRIIVTSTMEPDQTYYLRFKNVLDNEKLQFYMDFIEFCPKEIYDNPMEPEDIW